MKKDIGNVIVKKSEFINSFPSLKENDTLTKEFQEYNNIAIRYFIGSNIDNTILGPDIILRKYDRVIIYSKKGGWSNVPLEFNKKGWFVSVGEKRVKVELFFDPKRNKWCYDKFF